MTPAFDQDGVTIYAGDCAAVLAQLPVASVQTCVTSPPYFNLRDYGIAGQIGLEGSPESYVEAMVRVFRAVRRVLRDDGTLWLNLGDSFATNPGNGRGGEGGGLTKGGKAPHRSGRSRIGTNIANFLNRLVKSGPLLFARPATIRVTGHGIDVSAEDQRFPYRVLLPLLGVERVTIKQRNNDFCQILHPLAGPCYCWVGCPVAFAARDGANLEIVLDAGYRASVVITHHDADGEPVFGIVGAGRTRTSKHDKRSLAVEETREPVTEPIADGQTFGNPVTFDAMLERLPDVYFVDQTVSLAQRLGAASGADCHFRVTKALPEQVHFECCGGGFDLAAVDVSHLFFLNAFGSFVRYPELYEKVVRQANAQKPKQELGIPDLVKRALMEDGWICRSTIIWHKPNPMPESVTDRPTKAHEYLFLLAKSDPYFYDADAVKECRETTGNRYVGARYKGRSGGHGTSGSLAHFESTGEQPKETEGRNCRSVWTIPLYPYPGAHFATFPPDLIEPCILAGSRPGDAVLDPFNGSGTTGAVCQKHGRRYVGIELNPAYVELSKERFRQRVLFAPGAA